MLPSLLCIVARLTAVGQNLNWQISDHLYQSNPPPHGYLSIPQLHVKNPKFYTTRKDIYLLGLPPDIKDQTSLLHLLSSFI